MESEVSSAETRVQAVEALLKQEVEAREAAQTGANAATAELQSVQQSTHEADRWPYPIQKPRPKWQLTMFQRSSRTEYSLPKLPI